MLAGLAVLAVAFADLPVARFCLERHVPGDLHKILSLAEVFAHGYGVLLILLTVAVLDQAHRRWIPRVAACAFLSGLVNLVVKLAVARRRPLLLVSGEQIHLPATAWQTFVGWFPVIRHGFEGALDHGIQSFPSGHTATAVGLAVGLSWLYPRGRWLFALFAALAAMQRVESGAHFLSDALVGAAVGCLVAAGCLHHRGLGRLFCRIERGCRFGGPAVD